MRLQNAWKTNSAGCCDWLRHLIPVRATLPRSVCLAAAYRRTASPWAACWRPVGASVRTIWLIFVDCACSRAANLAGARARTPDARSGLGTGAEISPAPPLVPLVLAPRPRKLIASPSGCDVELPGGADRAQRPRRVAHGHTRSDAGRREAHAQFALARPRAGRRFGKLAARVATRDRQRLVHAAVARRTVGASNAASLAVELFD